MRHLAHDRLSSEPRRAAARTERLLLLYCTLLLAATGVAAQSVPFLAVRVVKKSAGGFDVFVQNNYHSPAMDYVLANRYYRDSSEPCPASDKDITGRCVTLSSERMQMPHGALAGGPDPDALPPDGMPHVISGFSPLVTREPSVANLAVIYADGAMVGLPSVLNQLMLERRRALVDGKQDLMILGRAVANPSTNWAILAQRFKHRARIYGKLLGSVAAGGANGSQVYGTAGDPLCREVAEAIQPSPNRGGLRGAQAMMVVLQRDVAELEQSKPHLNVGDTAAGR